MEATQNGLQRISTPIGVSETTGLEVYESYTAGSGFNYMAGLREIQDLLIVEQIAEGTATTLLCGILIYNKVDKVLLKEVTVGRNVRYSRELVVELIKNSILELLIASCEKADIEINELSAMRHVEKMLDKCYFETSRKAIIEWARMVGIIN